MMIRTFEIFEFFKRSRDIYKRTTANFNCLSHFSNLLNDKNIKNDYHKLVKKYNITHVSVIRNMPKNIIEELNLELKNILNNYHLEIK